MEASLLRALMMVTVASSAAILLIALLRRPMRAAVGARAAYWLWLFVPALVFAALLPAPSVPQAYTLLPDPMHLALSGVQIGAVMRGGPPFIATAMLAIWAAGALSMFVAMIHRQRSFIRSLGERKADAEGMQRSQGIVAPLLVGVWRPAIVVPADFEARYTLEERELILSHERAHLLRRDVAVNALASVWLCLCWFNPLVFWAIRRLRLDQELACDALVLARPGTARGCYADALLKTQLATESSWRLPIESRWQSNHPLKERITMLKRPLPGRPRRWLGATFALALIGSGSYVAWAAKPVGETDGAQVLVDIKLTATNADSRETHVLATRYLVHSGETPPHMKSGMVNPIDFGCTAFLPAAAGAQSARDANGTPDPSQGQVLLKCIISRDGQVVATPALIAWDGQSATIETAHAPHHYKIEIVASTSAEKIVAAKKTVSTG